MSAEPLTLDPAALGSDTLVGRGWVDVCPVSLLQPERAVAALVHGAHVAVVLTVDGRLFAVDDHDPFTGASVLSRGIVGSRGREPDVPTLTSPLHKQVFDLTTGRCLDDPDVVLPTYSVRVVSGVVQVTTGVPDGKRTPRS